MRIIQDLKNQPFSRAIFVDIFSKFLLLVIVPCYLK